MQIDAHQHFWHPARGDYGWMPPDDPILTRPYAPAELWPQLQAAGIGGTVLVQAAPTVNETEYMLGLADATPWLKLVETHVVSLSKESEQSSNATILTLLITMCTV